MRRRDEFNDEQQRARWLDWLRGIVRDRGYDIEAPRGGGKTRLAADLGMSGSSVSRLLAGDTTPDYETIVRLARVLDISLAELLIRTGRATESDFPQTTTKTDHSAVSSVTPMTPEQVAEAAGVAPEHRDWFATMVRRMRQEADDDKHGGSATGGAAAER